MDTAQIEKLKALALAASPGPWFESDWGEDGGDNETTIEAREQEVLHPGQTSMWPDGVVAVHIADTEMSRKPIENAAFIAAANPATVLELIAENERLRARFEYIEDHATTHGGGNGFTVSFFVPEDSEDIGCGIDEVVKRIGSAPEAGTEKDVGKPQE